MRDRPTGRRMEVDWKSTNQQQHDPDTYELQTALYSRIVACAIVLASLMCALRLTVGSRLSHNQSERLQQQCVRFLYSGKERPTLVALACFLVA